MAMADMMVSIDLCLMMCCYRICWFLYDDGCVYLLHSCKYANSKFCGQDDKQNAVDKSCFYFLRARTAAARVSHERVVRVSRTVYPGRLSTVCGSVTT